MNDETSHPESSDPVDRVPLDDAGTTSVPQAGLVRENGARDDLEVDRCRSAVLANLRHELRTPINAIIGYSEMLIEDAESASDESFSGDVRKIHNSGLMLLDMVNALLDPKRLEEGRLDAEAFGARVRHELRTPLNHIIGYAEMLIEDARGAVNTGVVSDLERIHLSGIRLLSLIDQIVGLTRAPREAEEIALEDSAVSGMLRDVLETIHTIESPAAYPHDSDRGRLLLVDDNEINREMLSRQLRRQGHQVEVVGNGREALGMIEKEAFDLVLLDIMMPEINGIQVLEHIKRDPQHRDLPVIMISALDEIDSVVRCIEAGAEDYLPKPFNPTVLRARIGACLEKKRLRDREVVYLKQIETEKKRADDLLHVILPAEIVDELIATDDVKPRRYENVAVLFSDIVGFTPYCEDRDPEEIVSNLQELVIAFEEHAIQYNMQKIKTIGDSFMAAAGLFKPVANPVLDAVHCGLKIIRSAHAVRPHWDVRVGIHVGPVVGGLLGRRQYLFDLWGDTVNTAARMESNGRPGHLALSVPAWRQVEQHFDCDSCATIPVKGKGNLQFKFIDATKRTCVD
ncbi:Adenylate cyclase [Planctomycetes bacterium Pan216]|uniref:histidine kinase n=1 Tax=Kolteria novifilia TaxID=2527975 RepID=A0A518B8Z8_9BACT|nr:Adenylate cyclase [Planctomycetes bacterium Pan216]